MTAGFRKTLRYDVLANDTVVNPKVFLDAGNDGMKVDRNGNLYSTAAGNEIWSAHRKESTWGPSSLRKSPPSRAPAS